MRDFIPERDKFADTETDSTWRSTLQDVERFIASDTVVKMRKFLKGAPPLFGIQTRRSTPEERDIPSAEAARDLFVAALSAREASRNEDAQITAETLDKYLLRVTSASPEQQELLRSRTRLIQQAADILDDGEGDEGVLKREMGFTGNMEEDAEIVGVVLDLLAPVGEYARFLKRMVDVDTQACEARGIAKHWDASWCIVEDTGEIIEVDSGDKTDYLRLICALGYYEKNDAGFRVALSNYCDCLITLHMGDMRTICVEGQEVRSIATGIGSLWWSALDGMRIGRLGACEVCGKPFIANNERGKRRKYCSEACKQWRKVHPGETRIVRDKPSPPEWVNLDR